MVGVFSWPGAWVSVDESLLLSVRAERWVRVVGAIRLYDFSLCIHNCFTTALHSLGPGCAPLPATAVTD